MKIDREAYNEIKDKIRIPLHAIREDVTKNVITINTHMHIESIFSFLEDMDNSQDDNDWEVVETCI